MPSDILDAPLTPPAGAGDLGKELVGLDRLEQDTEVRRSRTARFWASAWPKIAAIGVVFALWQFLVFIEWKPTYLLPTPRSVLARLFEDVRTIAFWEGVGNTMRRALTGYAAAVVIGGIVGIAMARSKVVRTGLASLTTGLQTMPSIAWFPIAILLFQLSERAIFFVVVLGAAPSIANGILSGVDTVPPILLQAGRVLGARGFQLYRKVVIPAALPTAISGLKQGWAFAWRSLMAGELLVVIAEKPSIGSRMQFARDFRDSEGLYVLIIVILMIGLVVDSCFGAIERRVFSRRGLRKVAVR